MLASKAAYALTLIRDPSAVKVLEEDPGVRKFAIRTAGVLRIKPLIPKLQDILKNDREPGLRELARETLEIA